MKDWFKKIFKKKEGQTIEKAKENEDNCPDCVCFGGADRHGVDCVEKDEKLEEALEDHCQDTPEPKCDFSRKK